LVNRTAPQLNVFFLSMPIKSALGIFMLIIYLQYLLRIMVYDSDDAILIPIQKFFY
nr:flagellar biosynthetic protein FliR [Lentisphaeria bacterium]